MLPPRLAEDEGFEPPVRWHVHLFSRQAQSTTLSIFHFKLVASTSNASSVIKSEVMVRAIVTPVRKVRDSNPRYIGMYTCFQDRRNRPLCQPSIKFSVTLSTHRNPTTGACLYQFRQGNFTLRLVRLSDYKPFVGRVGLEPTTSSLSEMRSNQTELPPNMLS
jgi:hypothetical protein